MKTNGLTTSAFATPSLSDLVRIESPQTGAEVAAFLADGATNGVSIVPVGGGGALMIGNRTSSDAVGLSTSNLNRILDYQPTDMTLSVGAGTTLATVQDELGAYGQALPIEAVDPAVATIGGLLATALSGPRRYGAGTLRDVLIGISVAYPDGSVGKAGGLVVKNVSGFDMMRLHYGAFGSLGVIISANFKVLPSIRDEFSVRWSVDSLESAGTLVSRLRAPAVRPTALVATRQSGSWTLQARYEGRPGGLRVVADDLVNLGGDPAWLYDQESAGLWSAEMASRTFDDANEVRLRVGTLPSSTVATTAAVLGVLERHEIDATRLTLEPGVGLPYLSWSSQSAPQDVACITAIRALPDLAACTVLAAPDETKSLIDVWGVEPDAIGIMRALKAEYDPAGILNPGRFAGRI